MTCKFDQCDRPARAKGLCTSHYQQQRRGGELKPFTPRNTKPNPYYCNRCDTQKARGDFHLRTNGKPQWVCKECLCEHARVVREKERERRRKEKKALGLEDPPFVRPITYSSSRRV